MQWEIQIFCSYRSTGQLAFSNLERVDVSIHMHAGHIAALHHTEVPSFTGSRLQLLVGYNLHWSVDGVPLRCSVQPTATPAAFSQAAASLRAASSSSWRLGWEKQSRMRRS